MVPGLLYCVLYRYLKCRSVQCTVPQQRKKNCTPLEYFLLTSQKVKVISCDAQNQISPTEFFATPTFF